LSIALLILGLAGCGAAAEPPLVIATSWPPLARAQLERMIAHVTSDRQPVEWVELKSGERLTTVFDRRGGVDVALGFLPADYARLAGSGQLIAFDSTDPAPWRTIHRSRTVGSAHKGDPRHDPEAFALAKSIVQDDWVKGYEQLIRRSASSDPKTDLDFPTTEALECVAMTQGGKNPERARAFLQALTTIGLAKPPGVDAAIEATADELFADLLGAATVDALNELRDADAALRNYGHPAKAEASIGERPPWPPASVGKLRSSAGGIELVETLAEQIAPDPTARAWLVESWSRPKQPIDRALLVEIAGAADGRLAREPRFRSWLRGEWTAWTRQLYRRVARVAGGYVPS
jgi:hypothetical protein